MLEWRSTHHTENNQNYYTYNLEWVRNHQGQAGERANNPAHWFIQGETIYNQQVFVGQYNLSKDVIDLCTKQVPLNLTLENGQRIAKSANKNVQPSLVAPYIYFPASFGPQLMNNQQIAYNQPMYNQQQFGGVFNEGSLGSLRVSYNFCPTGPISIVGKSLQNTFLPFEIAEYEGTKDVNNGVPNCCCCLMSSCYAELLKPIENILEVEESSQTRQAMFAKAI